MDRTGSSSSGRAVLGVAGARASAPDVVCLRQGAYLLDVPWPDLVFAATDNRISLAALATRGRPRLGTRIYHAPLFNVYESGAVCLGSAQVGEMLGTQSIPAFEDAIFGSLFSHGNFRGNLARSHDGGVTSDADHLRFWRALSRDHVPVFPTDALVPMKTTLGAFLGLGGRR